MNNKFNSGKNKYLGLKINFWKKFLFLLHKLIKQKLLRKCENISEIQGQNIYIKKKLILL